MGRRRAEAGRAVPLPAAFAPYAWASTVEEVAARHGLEPAQVLKFDQNTPPLPGVAQVPLAESFATLNRYPARPLSRAARGRGGLREHAGRRRSRLAADRGRRGCRRPDPALRADVSSRPDARRRSCLRPTRCTASRRSCTVPSRSSRQTGRACSGAATPRTPPGRRDARRGARRARAAPPEAAVVVDEAYSSTAVNPSSPGSTSART